MKEFTTAGFEFHVPEINEILVPETKGVLLLTPFSDVPCLASAAVQLSGAEKTCKKHEIKYTKLESTRFLMIMDAIGNSKAGDDLKRYLANGIRTELDLGIFFHPNIDYNTASADRIIGALESLFGHDRYHVVVPEQSIISNIMYARSGLYTGRNLIEKLIV